MTAYAEHVARAKANNTQLANAAARHVFALRFSGTAVPKAVWDATTDMLNALESWFAADTTTSPERNTE